MRQATFIIPARDAGTLDALTAELRAINGVSAVQITPEPFDPFGPDAETRPLPESRVTLTYNPHITTPPRLRAVFAAHHIHVLMMHEA